MYPEINPDEIRTVEIQCQQCGYTEVFTGAYKEYFNTRRQEPCPACGVKRLFPKIEGKRAATIPENWVNTPDITPPHTPKNIFDFIQQGENQ